MYIDDRISNYLEQIVQKNGLTLIHIDGTELDPDVANGRKRAIIIKNNYKTNFSRYFRIANEISHLIYERSNDT